mmetsp:Transcript_29008/g.67985  ORF Transcript_29008/g.67985 Transcript_29008/m.67985 type:complete len:226 (-) Transcript_29008:63-740(-)
MADAVSRARRACATTRLSPSTSAPGARRQTMSRIGGPSALAYRSTGGTCCPSLSTSPRSSWATAWNVCEPPMTTRCVPRRHSTRLPPSSSLNAQPPASPSRRLSASSSNRGRADQGRAWSALAHQGRRPESILEAHVVHKFPAEGQPAPGHRAIGYRRARRPHATSRGVFTSKIMSKWPRAGPGGSGSGLELPVLSQQEHDQRGSPGGLSRRERDARMPGRARRR